MRRAIPIVLVAFLLGVALGPFLSEQRSILYTSAGDAQRLRAITSEGWVVKRSDALDGIGYLVTFERSRLAGLVQR